MKLIRQHLHQEMYTTTTATTIGDAGAISTMTTTCGRGVEWPRAIGDSGSGDGSSGGGVPGVHADKMADLNANTFDGSRPLLEMDEIKTEPLDDDTNEDMAEEPLMMSRVIGEISMVKLEPGMSVMVQGGTDDSGDPLANSSLYSQPSCSNDQVLPRTPFIIEPMVGLTSSKNRENQAAADLPVCNGTPASSSKSTTTQRESVDIPPSRTPPGVTAPVDKEALFCEVCNTQFYDITELSEHIAEHEKSVKKQKAKLKMAEAQQKLFKKQTERDEAQRLKAEKKQKLAQKQAEKETIKKVKEQKKIRAGSKSPEHTSPKSDSEGKGSFQCTHCDSAFDTKRSLGMHGRTHPKCTDCKGRFATKNILSQHVCSAGVTPPSKQIDTGRKKQAKIMSWLMNSAKDHENNTSFLSVSVEEDDHVVLDRSESTSVDSAKDTERSSTTSDQDLPATDQDMHNKTLKRKLFLSEIDTGSSQSKPNKTTDKLGERHLPMKKRKKTLSVESDTGSLDSCGSKKTGKKNSSSSRNKSHVTSCSDEDNAPNDPLYETSNAKNKPVPSSKRDPTSAATEKTITGNASTNKNKLHFVASEKNDPCNRDSEIIKTKKVPASVKRSASTNSDTADNSTPVSEEIATAIIPGSIKKCSSIGSDSVDVSPALERINGELSASSKKPTHVANRAAIGSERQEPVPVPVKKSPSVSSDTSSVQSNASDKITTAKAPASIKKSPSVESDSSIGSSVSEKGKTKKAPPKKRKSQTVQCETTIRAKSKPVKNVTKKEQSTQKKAKSTPKISLEIESCKKNTSLSIETTGNARKNIATDSRRVENDTASHISATSESSVDENDPVPKKRKKSQKVKAAETLVVSTASSIGQGSQTKPVKALQAKDNIKSEDVAESLVSNSSENAIPVTLPDSTTGADVTVVKTKTGRPRGRPRVAAPKKPTPVEELTCQACSTVFGNIGLLKNHIRGHKWKHPHLCGTCGLPMKSALEVKEHSKIHSYGKPFKCNDCDAAFTRRFFLELHVRTHTGEKPFSCNLCNKTFAQSSHLKMHLKVHSGEKPRKCEICGVSFVMASKLKDHMRIHTGERPFQCHICQKEFAQAYYLKIHLRTHSGDKPYKCSVCSQGFRQSCHVIIHMRTHTGENPYKCDQCGMAFRHSPLLKKHMKNGCQKTEEKHTKKGSSVTEV